MKKILVTAFALLLSTSAYSQSMFQKLMETNRFNKFIDEVNNGPKKLKYSDIQGSPYYYKSFAPAKLADNPEIINIRYNTLLDSVELLNGTDVYELPRSSNFPKFTFTTTNEVLVRVDTGNDFSGYFFELVNGKNRLLKKVKVRFDPEVPAPNTLISGTPARFAPLDPVYFIQTGNQDIQVPKKTEELLVNFTDNKDAVVSFIKSNKIKLNKEADLIKLVQFLNQ